VTGLEIMKLKIQSLYAKSVSMPNKVDIKNEIVTRPPIIQSNIR